MYKLTGKINETEIQFDIRNALDEIEFDVEYNAIAKLISENGTPVFKLWYVTLPSEEIEEIPEDAETIVEQQEQQVA